MADVMGAFIRGSEAAQAENEHQQALQDSKLRQMVLKHQLSEFKVNDALRANDLQRKFADLQLGQDSADGGSDLPSPVPSPTTSAVTAPARVFGPFASGYSMPSATDNAPAPPASLADVVSSGIRSRLDQGTGAAGATPVKDLAPPAIGRQVVDPTGTLLTLHADDSMPADHQPVAAGAAPGAAGAQTLGDQNHSGMRSNGRVWLQPIQIPEMNINIPGQWYSAKAAQAEEAARAAAMKRAEAMATGYNLGPGESRYIGDKQIATNTNPKANAPLNEQYDDAVKRGDQPSADRILASINATREHAPNSEFDQVFLPTFARDKLKKPVSALTNDDWSAARAAYAKSTQPPERPSWDVQTVHDDATGDDRLIRIDRASGAVQRVVLPMGVTPGRGKGGDDPQLPRGVQSYLMQLRTTYGTDLLGAEKELSAAWPQLSSAHPKISADKTVGALRSQFGAQAGASKFDELLNKMGVDPSTLGGAGRGNSGGRAGGRSATAPATAAPAPSTASGIVPGATVRLKNGQRVIVRTVRPDGTFDYDAVR